MEDDARLKKRTGISSGIWMPEQCRSVKACQRDEPEKKYCKGDDYFSLGAYGMNALAGIPPDPAEYGPGKISGFFLFPVP
jgi:hypothetical protein